MKSILKVLIIFSMGIVWMPTSSSYLESIVLWQKGNKKIGVFGDIHSKGKPDICHRKLLTPFLEQLIESNQKVEYLLEHSSEKDAKGNKDPDCIRYLSQYAFKHYELNLEHYRLKKSPLTFILSDIRTVFPGLNTIARGVYPFLVYLTTNSFNDLLTTLSIIPPIPASTLLAEIKRAINGNRKFKKEALSKECQIFFHTIDQKLTKYYQDLDNFFKIYNNAATIQLGEKLFSFPAGTIMASFLLALKANCSQDNINHIKNHYLLPVVDDIANAYFIREIIDSQQRTDTTLIYVGNAHAIVINTFLLDLGYTLNKDLSAGPIFYPMKGNGPAISKRHLKDFLAAFL